QARRGLAHDPAGGSRGGGRAALYRRSLGGGDWRLRAGSSGCEHQRVLRVARSEDREARPTSEPPRWRHPAPPRLAATHREARWGRDEDLPTALIGPRHKVWHAVSCSRFTRIRGWLRERHRYRIADH